MAHGENAERDGRPGYEYGSRRLDGYQIPGRFTKRLTHRLERKRCHRCHKRFARCVCDDTPAQGGGKAGGGGDRPNRC